jgi:hypothetical protein
MSDNKVTIVQYNAYLKKAWDEFVIDSKNSYFFFLRDFMEYHQDRFVDNSLLIYYESKLIALFPANKEDDILVSHRGLTFGSLIQSYDIKLSKAFEIFSALKAYLINNNFKKLIYKSIPYPYHNYPSDEDIISLNYIGARLVCRESTSVIDLRNRIPFAKGKRGSVKKAVKSSVAVQNDENFFGFFEMMEKLLKDKYCAKPVHTLDEIKLLASRFPGNIKLYSAYVDQELVAGILMFIDKRIIKTQYISSSEKGRDLGAVDYLMDHILNYYKPDKLYCDLGTCTDNSETGFNQSLVAQKELMGARSVAKDVYCLNLGEKS